MVVPLDKNCQLLYCDQLNDHFFFRSTIFFDDPGLCLPKPMKIWWKSLMALEDAAGFL